MSSVVSFLVGGVCCVLLAGVACRFASPRSRLRCCFLRGRCWCAGAVRWRLRWMRLLPMPRARLRGCCCCGYCWGAGLLRCCLRQICLWSVCVVAIVLLSATIVIANVCEHAGVVSQYVQRTYPALQTWVRKGSKGVPELLSFLHKFMKCMLPLKRIGALHASMNKEKFIRSKLNGILQTTCYIFHITYYTRAIV